MYNYVFSGIPGELYYVRNGIINEYALQFNMPVKTGREIYFNWQNKRKSHSHAVSNLNVLCPDFGLKLLFFFSNFYFHSVFCY